MRKFLIILLFFTPVLAMADAKVEGVRLWAAPDNTRVVFDLTDGVEHKLFTLHNPERVVIDLQAAGLEAVAEQPGATDQVLERIRSAARSNGTLRVVLDLKRKVRPKSFLLKPNAKYGHRLVVDLYVSEGQEAAPRITQAQVPPDKSQRDIVIAIDAGHGGEDPGAIGHRGTREKDVVLALARKLYQEVEAQRGMRPVMIRDGDYFIGLRKRIEKARQHRADLFVSLHADAFHDKRARGSSVWVLAPSKAQVSETAAWLAEQENASDLIGGVSLEDKDDLVKTVLLDLSQTATIVESLEAGDLVLRHLRGVGKVHKRKVEQAGFVVLKSPDIPSMLVETAFISNPSEEENLRSARHQSKMAQAIFSGIRDYFSQSQLPGTKFAANSYGNKHVIKRGDTLSGIAAQFNVSLQALRAANGLRGDTLHVGKTLDIPL